MQTLKAKTDMTFKQKVQRVVELEQAKGRSITEQEAERVVRVAAQFQAQRSKNVFTISLREWIMQG